MCAAKQSVQAIATEMGRSEPAIRARLPKLSLAVPQPIPGAPSGLEHFVSNYWQFAITIVLGAAALSGKFSAIATQILLLLAWFVILLGELRHSWLRRVSVGLSTGAALILAALFFRPDAVPKFSGLLTPKEHKILFSEKTNRIRIEMGQSGLFLDQIKNGDLLFPFLKREQLRVELVNDSYKFSTKITDKSGELIAAITDNEWSVAPPRSYDRNYDENALEVLNNFGDVVLQVQALPDRIQIQGVWWSDDSPWGRHVRLIFSTIRVLTVGGGPDNPAYGSEEPFIFPVDDGPLREVPQRKPFRRACAIYTSRSNATRQINSHAH
jgi:hypothetical protein